MVGCRGKTCARAGCPRNPCYGVKGSRTREFCAAHAPPGMVNVCHKICVREGCSKRPSYGVKGINRREFCEAHSEPGMVNLNIRCCRASCNKMAGYGIRGRLCLLHIKQEMFRASASASIGALSPAAKVKKEIKASDSSRSTSGKRKRDHEGAREVSRAATSASSSAAATSSTFPPRHAKPIPLSNAPAPFPPPSPMTPASRSALNLVDMMKIVAAKSPEAIVAGAPPAVISSLMSSVASAAALLVAKAAAPKREIKLEKTYHSPSVVGAAKRPDCGAIKPGEAGHGRRAQKRVGVKQEYH